MIDLPRFASTLKRLTAVKCRLWTKWDLSRFEPLRALEVSFANRTTLEQLARKVGGRKENVKVGEGRKRENFVSWGGIR